MKTGVFLLFLSITGMKSFIISLAFCSFFALSGELISPSFLISLAHIFCDNSSRQALTASASSPNSYLNSLSTMLSNVMSLFHRIEKAAGIKTKGLHAFRHTFATKLINGTKCADGNIKTLNIKAVADILGHTTTEITERYYVKKDNSRLTGITDGFEI